MPCSCGDPLNESVVMTYHGERLKSCPHCSTRAGRHQFLSEAYFGTRDMGDGRVIVQSWCPECRSDLPEPSPTAECPPPED